MSVGSAVAGCLLLLLLLLLLMMMMMMMLLLLLLLLLLELKNAFRINNGYVPACHSAHIKMLRRILTLRRHRKL